MTDLLRQWRLLARTPTADVLRATLAPLDAMPGGFAVAAYLAGQGIKGQQAAVSSCPISVYLKAKTGLRFVMVTGATARVSSASGKTLGRIELSTPCREFVRGFDKGDYPGLIKEWRP